MKVFGVMSEKVWIETIGIIKKADVEVAPKKSFPEVIVVQPTTLILLLVLRLLIKWLVSSPLLKTVISRVSFMWTAQILIMRLYRLGQNTRFGLIIKSYDLDI
jgi:hypothetical protein